MESSFGDRVKAVWGGALDVLLPAQCPLSEAPVARPGDLAPEAWARLHFLDDPVCDVCGAPFAFDPGPGAICGACAARPPAFDRARSALLYTEHSRALVLGLKHGDRTDGIAAFARWMARAGGAILKDADALAPTPLHWRRLFKRRFNQSALLAQALSRQTGLPHWVDLLERVRPTPSQGGLTADQRRRNVAGAFRVRARWRERISGRTVVLIDDVLTSGATLGACAAACRRAGAAEVRALTLARVVRDGAVSI